MHQEAENFSQKKIEELIADFDVSNSQKREILKNLFQLKNAKVNVLITGATGSGKSSTINALFQSDKAKVGMGADPETMSVQKYEFDNLVIWDSPGLGDGKEADNTHAKNIIKKLAEVDENGDALIDVVLVILDGGSRDLGTSYALINEVIIPNLGPDTKRLLVAINQADQAMKGRGWNEDLNCPEPKLEKFLQEKVDSTRNRINEATGVEIDPIYYCAGYCDEYEQAPPYNMGKLYSYILASTPVNKRIVYADKVAQDPDVWKHDDGVKKYGDEIKKSYFESIQSIFSGAISGAATGAEIGRSVAGIAGAKIGSIVGGILGAGKQLFGIFG